MAGTRRELIARARAFRADDPDPDTCAELDALLRADDLVELRERFDKPLEFGTAGLRGLLGAGDARMNRRVVAQTTAGLCAYLLEHVADAKKRGLCIGFDGRHKSRELAAEVAAVATGAGFAVFAFETVVPTPLLAFSVLDRSAAAGVMITASHNPAAYNGYKIYLTDGAQLGEPHDAAIAERIRSCGPVLALPRMSEADARAGGLWHDPSPCEVSYLAALRLQLLDADVIASPLTLRVAYTAMHGVGQALAHAALRVAGVHTLQSVAAQAEPDPKFPTVVFPNPEEPHAMDLLLELATSTQADLAFANDPDADRLAVAVRTPEGALQVLTGNEVGILLADYLLARAPGDGKNLVVSTIVSTPMLEQIAAAHAARAERTLTGFKWIVQRGLALQASDGLRFVLGFEEALGYCIGSLVRDKDGIAAAAHVCRMAAWHGERGTTLYAALIALYRQHGLYESRQRSFTAPGPGGLAELSARVQQLRAAPPTEIGGMRVTGVADYASEVGHALPKSDVLSFALDAAHRLTIRPSGTEPKLKVYIDCVTTIAPAEALETARARVQQLADALSSGIAELTGLS